jgi:hypothetical protein
VQVAKRQEIFEYLGRDVLKVGGTTGITVGVVEACEFTSVPIVGVGGYTRQYDGLFAIRGQKGQRFSAPGDSGAVVFDRKGVLLGMVLAGSDELTFAVPLSDVLRALNCTPLFDN